MGSRSQHPDVKPGSVVLVDAPESDEYLVAAVAKAGDNAVTVIPLSERIELASDWDLMLERSVIGWEAMAETWNYGQVLPEQVVEKIAEVRNEIWEELEALLRAVIAGDEQPQNAHVGAKILVPSDPRFAFQDEESERMRPYLEPLSALVGSATLGQLVAHRREELGLEPGELEFVSLQRGWIDDLEHDTLDIERTLQPNALAALMRRLRIGASQRLGRIALGTIEAFQSQRILQSGRVFARRRRGYPTGSSRGRSPDDYVSEFLRELEKDE